MSSDNASVLREGFEAFMRGDVDTLRELIEPDAQWLALVVGFRCLLTQAGRSARGSTDAV
jgi:ketosteroid isomerase-like protein